MICKQLAVVRLQVRQQPHLFQQLVRQVLRFVNDQHRFLAALDLLEQELVDDRQGIQPVQAVNRQAELQRNRLHQLAGAHDRVEDQGGGVVIVELLEHRAAKGRLARADLAGHLDKALALANPVEQVIERFPVFGAVEQEPRVRRDVERRLGQAIVIQVHAILAAERVPWSRRGRRPEPN